MRALLYRLVLLASLASMGLVVACRTRVNPASSTTTMSEMAPVESPQQAVRIAEAYALKMDFAIGRAQPPIVKRFVTPENDIVGAGHETDYKERIRQALRGKVYWMVYYQPKETQLGGDYVFFIDEGTGAVLAHYAGR